MAQGLPYGILYVLRMVRQRLLANGCTCPLLFGEEHVGDHDPAPRIVVFPDKKVPDKFTGPMPVQARGPIPQDVAAWKAQGGQNPKSVRLRYQAFEAHIWARAKEQSDPSKQREADQLALDCLVSEFCCQLYYAAPGNDQMQGGQQVVLSKSMNHGQLYVLHFTVQVPILDAPFPPGVIDERSYTWPLETGVHAHVKAESLGPDGETVTSTAEFDAPPQA